MQSRLQDPRRRFHSVHDGVAMYARFRPQAVRIREAARSRQAADIDPTGGRAAACAPQARVEHDVLRHRPRRRQRRARSANVAACPGQRQHLYVVGDRVRSAAAPCAGGRRRGHAARSVTRRGAAQAALRRRRPRRAATSRGPPRAQQDAVLSRPALDVAGPVFLIRGVRRGDSIAWQTRAAVTRSCTCTGSFASRRTQRHAATMRAPVLLACRDAVSQPGLLQIGRGDSTLRLPRRADYPSCRRSDACGSG